MSWLSKVFDWRYPKTPTPSLEDLLRAERAKGETRVEIFSKIDFPALYKEFNKGTKRKLSAKDKRLLKLVICRHLPTTRADAAKLSSSLMVGSPLQVESLDLDAVLKQVTFDDKHIKLHKFGNEIKK